MSKFQSFRLSGLLDSTLLPARVVWLNRLSLLGIIAFALWYTTSFQIRRQSLDVRSLIDYGLNYEKSVSVSQQLVYPPMAQGFLYPPPNIMLRLALGELGLEASAVLWMAILMIALFACLEMSLSLLGLAKHPVKYGLALVALLSVEYPVEWDVRALNGNTVYLILVLGGVLLYDRSRPYAAGFLLGASVAFKVYSVLFVPYFLWRREYRLSAAMVASLAGFFMLLPALWFGIERSVAISASWIHAVAETTSQNLPWEYPAYLLSIHKTLLTLLTEKGGSGVFNMANLAEGEIQLITRGIQVLWLVFAALYFWRSPSQAVKEGTGKELLMDAAALMLVPLPLAPVLQPHHGVVLLIPALILVWTIIDVEQRPVVRLGSAVLLLSAGIELQFGPSGPLRGLGMLLTMIVFMGGLLVLKSAGVSQRSDPRLSVPGSS